MVKNYFACFGLKPGPDLQQLTAAGGSIELDSVALRSIYQQLLSKIHPDQLIGVLPQQIQLAETLTAEYTKAFQCLNNPLERVRYWLLLEGIDLEKASSTPSFEFFEAQMALQEDFEAIRAAYKQLDKNKPAARAEWQASLQGFQHQLKSLAKAQLEWFIANASQITDPALKDRLATAFSQMALAGRLMQQTKDIV